MSAADYQSAGVDIAAGDETVRRIAPLARSTFDDTVLAGIGSFGSFVDLGPVLREYRHPVLVQSIDGVGTKVAVARRAGSFHGIGRDVVSATVNDILVHGARPLTFLDYLATERLDPAIAEEIVAGMAANCRENHLPLVGGETAEMPSTYREGEHDVVGCVTGVVERDQIVNGSTVEVGDRLLGLPSNGLHTNGYSLARKVFFEIAGLGVGDRPEGLGETVGAALLRPHLNYRKPVEALLASGAAVRGMAHITGGGIPGNLGRILPAGTAAEVETASWEIPPVFRVLAALGEVARPEMFRTFNMGIGLIAVVAPEDEARAREALSAVGSGALPIGTVVPGGGEVHLAGRP